MGKGCETTMLGYNSNRDTSRWGEGDKSSAEEIEERALSGLSRRKPIQFDTFNDELTTGGKTKRCLEALRANKGKTGAMDFLASHGYAVGTYSRENAELY